MRDFLLSIYPWLKGLHIAAVIAWMAGMLYLPRLFVYHHQAEKGGEAERFFIQMERRLLKGIINPAMIAVWLIAALMLVANPALFKSGWFLTKLALVIALSAIHGGYARAQRQFAAGERVKTERYWRIMNEIPFAIAIVVALLAMAKPF